MHMIFDMVNFIAVLFDVFYNVDKVLTTVVEFKVDLKSKTN